MGVRVGQIVRVCSEATGRVGVPHSGGTATVSIVGREGAIGRRVRLATAAIGWRVGRVGRWTGVVVAWGVVKWEVSGGLLLLGAARGIVGTGHLCWIVGSHHVG